MINFLKFKITFLGIIKKLPKARKFLSIFFGAFIIGENLKKFHFEYLKLAIFRMRLSKIDHCGAE
jgi:hypothetical protein